jgi:hypothetical protein
VRYLPTRSAIPGALALITSAVTAFASAKPPLILVPAPTQRSATYYQHGQPIASVAGDSASVLLAADDVTLYGKQYLRVWVLYFNRTDHPVLLDPLHSVVARASVAAEPAKKSRLDHDAVLTHVGVPELPYKLMAEGEDERNRAQIATVIGGALETAVVGDRGDRATARTGDITRRTEWRVADIGAAHEMFAASFNAGTLKKHSVFPRAGVDGYLYIPLRPYTGEGKYKSAGSLTNDVGWMWPRQEIRYTVLLDLPGVVDSVTFAPGSGE